MNLVAALALGLVYPIVRRLREVHRAASLIEAGMPEQKVAGSLGMPPWLAKRTVARARTADRAALERALEVFADLAPPEELRRLAETACRAAVVARAMTWQRGAAGDPRFVDTPREVLAVVGDPDWLAGT